MGRYPLGFKIWSSCIKYFVRLSKGTNNIILDSAFAEAKCSDNGWYRGIKKLLLTNGFGDIFQSPTKANANFPKTFEKRLPRSIFSENI